MRCQHRKNTWNYSNLDCREFCRKTQSGVVWLLGVLGYPPFFSYPPSFGVGSACLVCWLLGWWDGFFGWMDGWMDGCAVNTGARVGEGATHVPDFQVSSWSLEWHRSSESLYRFRGTCFTGGGLKKKGSRVKKKGWGVKQQGEGWKKHATGRKWQGAGWKTML